MRQTSWHIIKEGIVTAVFDVFHLCGMVSKDTGAFDRQSENAFVVDIISIHVTKKRWYRYEKIDDTYHIIVDVTLWQQTSQKS